MKKTLLFFLGLFFSLIIKAQETPPEVSRFLQVNTYNGGHLSHLISDQNNNSFLTGIANGSNFSFDGYNIKPIGIDDMFVIKTNANGQNQWIKTVNAGNKGSVKPTKSYLNPNGEVFITGSFSGTINFANKEVTSQNGSSFIIKYGTDGSEKWISTFSNNVVDMSFAVNDIFVAENYQIFKINNDDGTILKSRDLSSNQFKVNALYADILNSTLFLGGVSNLTTTIDGVSIEANKGTVLRGDYYNLTFTESSKFEVAETFGVSEIFDLRMLSDRSLAVVGLSSGTTSFKNNLGQIYYANNPENFSGSGYYLFVAKIAPDFSALNWLRTSTKMDQIRFSPNNNNAIDVLEIFAFDMSNFRVLFKKNRISNTQYTNPNGFLDKDDGFVSLMNFEYSNGMKNTSIADWSDGNTNVFLTYNGNGVQRYDKTTLFFITGINGGFAKIKLDSEFGTLSSNYIKHTGSDGSLFNYTYQCGKTNYFGSELNNIKSPSNNTGCSNIISKIAPNGNLVWKSQIIGTSQSEIYPNRSGNISDHNASGENVVVSEFTNQAQFLDNNNSTINFTKQNSTITNYISLITNLNPDGTLKWAKKIEPTTENKKIKINSVAYDNNGDVIFAGMTNDTFLIDDVAYNFNKNAVLFLMKLDASTGNVLFVKQFKDIDGYMIHLDTDNENNIYLSLEPYSRQQPYNFGNLQIPFSVAGVEHLFIKFDSSGNALLGKNFYANNLAGDNNYSWPLSLKFDGENFIISGEMFSQNRTNYKGIDGQTYNNPYSTYNLSDFIAKVDKLGNVIWHKPIFGNNRIIQNKADIDNLGNVYYYIGTLGNINIDGNETSFPTDKRSSAIVKLSGTDGSLKYLKNLGIHTNYIYNSSLSVLQNNVFSFSGNADNQDQFLYPINNHNASNYYIATLGKLPTPYLTPKDNYLLVTNIEVSNNITDNTSEVDLITNVDWTATSNLNWLTISSEKYTSKKQTSTTTINGSGDHKIKLSALQNLTGSDRTAIITLTGNGVSSKEIIVKQSATLGITEISEKRILIYPNPTKDIVFLESKEIINSLELYDLQGKLLKQQNCNSKKVQVSVRDLPNAVYIIRAKTINGIETFKVIKN